MASQAQDESDPGQKILKWGAEILGGAAGALIGFAAAGPTGAAIGGAVGPLVEIALREIGVEVEERLLGDREKVRIGAAWRVARDQVRQKLASGQQPRQDDFFHEKVGERTAAHEILEGVVLAAQREYQEKKVPFYGCFFANLAFRSDVSRAQGNMLLRIADQMSYRQLCLLAMFQDKDKYRLRAEKWEPDSAAFEAAADVLEEVYELYTQYLVNITNFPFVWGAARPLLTALAPGCVQLQSTGRLLCELMSLSQVASEDIQSLVRLLG